jgi:hypothetical protein
LQVPAATRHPRYDDFLSREFLGQLDRLNMTDTIFSEVKRQKRACTCGSCRDSVAAADRVIQRYTGHTVMHLGALRLEHPGTKRMTPEAVLEALVAIQPRRGDLSLDTLRTLCSNLVEDSDTSHLEELQLYNMIRTETYDWGVSDTVLLLVVWNSAAASAIWVATTVVLLSWTPGMHDITVDSPQHPRRLIAVAQSRGKLGPSVSLQIRIVMLLQAYNHSRCHWDLGFPIAAAHLWDSPRLAYSATARDMQRVWPVSRRLQPLLEPAAVRVCKSARLQARLPAA